MNLFSKFNINVIFILILNIGGARQKVRGGVSEAENSLFADHE